ncbi:aromatic ring-hydroxylating oxygenase subunit alpha [Segnochrobactrum spirostomi]|uniref:Aromatic ring-hydroxylating dioxygenase subunit alpha n=1 Tax=Segnochrobactrum spirostomi TaxID=2608987 RepID=A0A6A7YBG8_9HYPH|nr:aromatic ring-hydroxylating dioxygenase subunit alpha [Segnochrobactrum spirostomi]MQT15311.1 aromatic ring-hydroxylating dioxygenase subunit alpha [Segnochrobactrum spirostomi]
MFLPSDHSKTATPLPRDCSFRESDWLVLARFWHPVAFAHEVADKPVAARLLDVDLVLYRTTTGITVARDLCPHRGTRISRGFLDGDRLVCPMHGLAFDGTGACRKIPSLADQTAPIPPKLRLQTVLSEERYGIVWACLAGTPIWPLPRWEGIENPAFKKLHMPVDTWKAAASRHVENFNDIAHFPWVHPGSFGGDTDWAAPHYDVKHTEGGLAFAIPYLEGGNRFPDGVTAERRPVVYHYELTFPFSTLIKVDPQDSDFVHFFADTVCPVSARETRIFQVVTDTTGDPDPALWTHDALVINAEDKPMVEEQRPEDLPLDLRDEIHIPADRFSIEYRRALVSKFGLGAPLSS